MPLTLACAEYGAGPPVVILHGLFGSGTNWTAVARSLGEKFHVFTLDMRNHGTSPWAEDMGYEAMSADVDAFIAARCRGRAAVIGHSMGGKAAMVLALTRPERIERLVVVDIAPVVRPITMVGYAEAMRALDLHGVSRRGAADALLRPSIPDDAIRLFLLQNLVPGPDGLRWRLNLDAILAGMAALVDFPEPAAARPYDGPTLVMRGARSDYVRDEDLPVFARLFPRYTLVTVPDAGHWVHAERTEPFLAAVEEFLGAS